MSNCQAPRHSLPPDNSTHGASSASLRLSRRHALPSDSDDDESRDYDVVVISNSDDDDDTAVHDSASYAKAVSGGTDSKDAPDRGGGDNDDGGADSDEGDGGHLVRGAGPRTTAGPSRMSAGLWYRRRPLIRRGEFTSGNAPAPVPELTMSGRPRAGTGRFSLILLVTLFLSSLLLFVFASFHFLIS